MKWVYFVITGGATLVSLGICLLSWIGLSRFLSRTVPKRDRGTSLSVIIPIKGADEFTAHRMETAARVGRSLQAEVIVAMESTDDAAHAALRSTPDIQVVISGPSGDRSGKVHNMAAGVRMAKGEIIAFMDADVELRPEAVMCAVDALESDPRLAAVSALPHYRQIAGAGGVLIKLFSQTLFFTFLGQDVSTGPQNLIGGFMAIRRTDLDALGGVERYAFHISDDGAIGRDLRARGRRISLIPVALFMDEEPAALRAGIDRLQKWLRVSKAHLGWLYWQLLLVSPVIPGLAFSIGLWTWHGPRTALTVLLPILVLRVVSARQMDRSLASAEAPRMNYGWAPLLDLLLVLIWCEALTSKTITWKGRTYRVGPSGTVRPL